MHRRKNGAKQHEPQLPTVRKPRKKRRSKYDIPSSLQTTSHFVSYPGQSKCHSSSSYNISNNHGNNTESTITDGM